MRRHLKITIMVERDKEEIVVHVSPIIYVKLLSEEFYLP